MAEKKSNREKLKEITASIEQGIQDLFQSDKYAGETGGFRLLSPP